MDQQVVAILRSGLVTFAALLPIVNPLGAAPIFLSMSADLPAPARRQLAQQRERRAFFPLTFPLTVGPGSISIAITLGARVPARGVSALTLFATDMGAVLFIALSVYLSYRFASQLIAYLGETGTAVFLRLSAFILMCVGVSITWSGIVELIEPLLQR